MSDSRDAGALILRNLKIFNDAAVFVETNMQPEIFGHINDAIKAFSETNGWTGSYSYLDGDCWTAPKNWTLTNESNAAWFWFCTEDDDGPDEGFDISDICGLTSNCTGFRFNIYTSVTGRKRKTAALTQEFHKEVSPKMGKIGFRPLSASSYFLPVTLDAEQLATAWKSSDYSAALKPIIDGLDRLKMAAQILSPLVEAVIKQDRELSGLE
jgi:hypothetical protein